MRTYNMAWEAFQAFRDAYHFNVLQVPTIEQLALFISYMSCYRYAASTIATYVSGISFCLRNRGMGDITQVFPIRHLVEGCRRLHVSEDVRCPITLSILKRLLTALPRVCINSYDCKMFTAAFLIAFFGFLRIGEFTTSGERVPLVDNDVMIRGSSPNRRLCIAVRFSKTDQRGAGCVITIPEGTLLCPVQAALEYTRARPARGTAFFRRFDSSPLSRYEFNRVLQRCVSFLGLPLQCYTAHSFRIGAATSAAMAGFSDSQIQLMGRWTSLAYRRYIRL